MSIGLPEQILDFVDFISRVNGNKNCTDFSCCPECDEPLRQVGKPDRNLIAGFYAESDERARKGVNVVSERNSE